MKAANHRERPERIELVKHLYVYETGFEVAMAVFRESRNWPPEERYALTGQVRRSSRAICANLAEAWAKRRYPDHFGSKLSDAHAEAEETLTWLRFASACEYVPAETADELSGRCRQIISGLLKMINHPEDWCLEKRSPPARREVP